MLLVSKQPCGSCNSTDYYYSRFKFCDDGSVLQYCNSCSDGGIPSLAPDVYFDPSKGANQTDPNLCDRYTGPIPFSSKREKAAILKRLGLQEAGDKVHGSRNFDKKSSKQWDR